MKKYYFQNTRYFGFYALSVYAENLKQAKNKLKKQWNLERLPKNTASWSE